MTRQMTSSRHEELTRPAKSCTADRSDASHAAHEARGDGIEKREKVAWVARDRRDKGQGLLDVAREMYKLTACTTIEINKVTPQFLCSLKSKRLSSGSEFLLEFLLIFVAFCVASASALRLRCVCVIVAYRVIVCVCVSRLRVRLVVVRHTVIAAPSSPLSLHP